MATLPPPMLDPAVQPDPSAYSVTALEDLWPDLLPPGRTPPMAPPGPRPRHVSIQLDPDQQSRLLYQLREHYDEAIQSREEQEARRALRYRRYLADPTLRDGMQPWTDAPQVFTSLTRNTMERLADEMMDVLLTSYDTITVKGIGEEDVQGAKRKEQFLRWALETLNHFKATLRDGLMDALLDGLGVLKVYPQRLSFDGWLTPDEQAQMGQTLALLQTIIQIETVDQGNLLIPPDATGLQYPEARYLGEQHWVHTIDDFPDLRQRGYQLIEVDPWGFEPEGQQQLEERIRLQFSRDSLEPQQLYRGRVEMVGQYERFDVDGDGIREFIVVHWFPGGVYGDLDSGGALARVLLLKDALPQTQFPRPMWPYFGLRFWRQARQLRGMNVPDRLETAQDVLNRLIEQCLQQGEIDILPFFFYNVALTGELPDLTQVKPGQGVPIETGGNVVFKPNTSHNQHYAELLNMVRALAEEDTSVTSFTQGRSSEQPNQPRTVGGLALLLQQGNKAFAQQALDLADQVSDPIEYDLALWQHHMPPQVEIPLPNTEAIEARLLQGQSASGLPLQPTTITADDMSGVFDLSIGCHPDALADQQKFLSLAEHLDQLLQDYPIGRRLLWKDIWEKMGLQQFDLYWPEEWARIQTMLHVLQADMQLGQLEMGLMQEAQAGLTPPPESAALLGGGQPQPGPGNAAPPQGPTPFPGGQMPPMLGAGGPPAVGQKPMGGGLASGIAGALSQATQQANTVGGALSGSAMGG